MSQLLSVDELPSSIPIENILITITKTNLETSLMTRNQRKQVLQNSNYFNANSLESLSFAVIWNENKCYLFDSHWRDMNEFASPKVPPVLLKFGSIYEVHKYIREVYFIEVGNLSQYYQIQHLQAATSPVEVPNCILEVLGRKRKRTISTSINARSIPST